MIDYHTAPLVLIVESDQHIAQFLLSLLERHGYKTLLAVDGLEARKIIDLGSDLPDLIVLDAMLPYIDGFELIRIVRAKEGWNDTPILMLTAKAAERDIVRSFDVGANDYIVKPFQPNELLARMRRFLRETV